MNLKLFRVKYSLLLLGATFLLSGCASIVSKSTYPITINSTPSGAKITVKDLNGIDVYSGVTPANIKLKAGAGFFTEASYTVTFEMDGYYKRVVPIEFKLDGWYFGNIVFGGLIGLIIVDPITGAMWKLDTKFINETLSQMTSSTNQPSLKILSYNDIPQSWKDKLIKIK